jgi:hypothetical protein
MVHTSEANGRPESTRTRVLRDPDLVPIQLIRPTEPISPLDCRQIRYSPICLVKHPNGLLYIVDGNHRFHKKAYFEEDCSKILAWILLEGDQHKIEGESIPGILAEWKAGKITLQRLAEIAYAEANSAMRRHEPLSDLTPHPNKSISPVRVSQIKKDPEWPVTRKFDLVMQILQNHISIKMASRKYSLPMRTIEEWIHISVRAVRDALQDESETVERFKSR